MAVPNKVTVPRNVLPELGDVIHTSRLGQADVAGKAGADACCWVGAGRVVGRRVGVALTALVASTSAVGVGASVGVSANIGDVATTADDGAGVGGTGVGVTGLVGNMTGVILRSTKTIILPLSPLT